MTIQLTAQQRRDAFSACIQGMLALERAENGAPDAAEEAITHLRRCLEWATAETWSGLCTEAQLALADAYVLRRDGNEVANLRLALGLYRAALNAYTMRLWPGTEEGFVRYLGFISGDDVPGRDAP